MLTIDVTNFPDANFRKYLLEQGYGKNGVLTDADVEEITNIDVCGEGIHSLKGIEYFTALIELSCDDNLLTELDLSKNTELAALWCTGNRLISLNVSMCTALTHLDCSANLLTALDVSKNTALTTLACANNWLTILDVSKNVALEVLLVNINKLMTLDLSKNTALTHLYCHSNRLTELDVSQNIALTILDCSHNPINGEVLDALICSLPENATSEQWYEDSACTMEQVATIKAKGWMYMMPI